ncbi:MAG: serine/threonine protein kinase, partial [Myxococcales bacterium]
MVARLTAGTVFAGEYRVERTLFEGDDRGVYEVEQQSTGKRLALKVLSPGLLADEPARARFVDEARVNGRVKTEHVLDVRAAGIDGATGYPWVASELLEGDNLDQAIARATTLPLKDWDELLSQTLHGLAAVHH